MCSNCSGGWEQEYEGEPEVVAPVALQIEETGEGLFVVLDGHYQLVAGPFGDRAVAEQYVFGKR